MTVKKTKLVALTFDDGPSRTTLQVLDILEEYQVPATFFLAGQYVNEDTKSIMQKQLKLGCELANHSLTHRDMSVMSKAEIKYELDETSKRIKDLVQYDVKFFRPPYIALSDTMYESIDMPFIQGVGCMDWEETVTPEERVETILETVQDGTIVLLHDFEGNENTVKALPSVIEGLKEQGYTFVTVSDLFELNGVNPNVKHKIWSNITD